MAAPSIQMSRAACTWKRVGRGGSVALGQGGDTALSVNPSHKSSMGGSERRGPFKHIGREAAREGSWVFWSEWNFSKNKFFCKPFLPRLLKWCVVMRRALKRSCHCRTWELFASQEQLESGLNTHPSFIFLEIWRATPLPPFEITKYEWLLSISTRQGELWKSCL